MECIIPANPTILGILGKTVGAEPQRRIIKYCISLPVADGVLLLNTLTREMLLLDAEEYASALTSDYLYEHYFTVPENQNEQELVELVRWVRSTLERKIPKNRSYTILPTTDCNARCFYCYESGCNKISMSQETAEKTAAYLISQSGGKPIRLRWFGGEPLMNYPAIDSICDKLCASGISFQSHMTSNAYLFQDALVAKAAKDWHLKNIQVTLDGTEAVYNRSKAYIHAEGSPFQTVLDNIDRLLNADIAVVIRMNLGLHNPEDLLTLAQQLVSRFAGRQKLRAYVSPLFDTETSWHEFHTSQEWDLLFLAQQQLEEFLFTSGLAISSARRILRDLPIHYCMADSGNAELILPDGRIGLCEHHTDDEFIGHIDSPHRDAAMIASWQERFDPLPECAACAHYPECIELKKCNGRTVCFEQSRNHKRRKAELAMHNEYQLWQKSRTCDLEAEPEQKTNASEYC